MAKSKILSKKNQTRLDRVKNTIHLNIQNASPKNILQVACDNFKYAFKEAIKIDGDKGKESLTTSSKHINLFHEVVKSELISGCKKTPFSALCSTENSSFTFSKILIFSLRKP